MIEKINPKKYYKNPRKISEEQRKVLKEGLKKFGDLSGIVHDLNSNEIISGNQRSSIIDISECEIKIEQTFSPPTQTGTVARGVVIWKGNLAFPEGEEFSYRQVKWTTKECEEANILANKAGGEWDFEILGKDFDQDSLLEVGFESWEFEGFDGGNEEDYGEEFSLKDGDRESFQQMTFTLADKQSQIIKDALKLARSKDDFGYCETFGNENSNGNGLYFIVAEWVKQNK